MTTSAWTTQCPGGRRSREEVWGESWEVRRHIDRRVGSGRAQRRTWLLWPALLPDANREVVDSVHTAFTVCQVFAAPLGSRPDVQADQGCPPKASSSFSWEWGWKWKENSRVLGTTLPHLPNYYWPLCTGLELPLPPSPLPPTSPFMYSTNPQGHLESSPPHIHPLLVPHT